MQLEQFLATLKSDGTKKTEGRFTISPEEARRKLREYQFHDPYAYILLVIASAVEGGATFLEITDTKTEMTLRYDGLTYRQQDFEAIYQLMFEGSGGPGAKLALALAGVERDVVMRSTSNEGMAVWNLTNLLASTQVLGGPNENFIQIPKAKSKWGIFSFLRGYAGFGPEARLIDSRCSHAELPIQINGQPVNRDYNLGCPLVAIITPGVPSQCRATLTLERSHFSPDLKMKVALAVGSGPTQVILHGVSYILSGVSGVTGVVWCDDLRTDLSQNQLAEDRYLTLLRDILLREYSGAVLAAVGQLDTFSPEQVETLAELLTAFSARQSLAQLLEPKSFLRLLTILKGTARRGLRAQLTLSLADSFHHRKRFEEAKTYYDNALFFLKETLRLDGPSLDNIHAAASALRGLGADPTTICDWTLFGASVALQQQKWEVARLWCGWVQNFAKEATRGGSVRRAASELGMAFCDEVTGADGRVESVFQSLSEGGLNLRELHWVWQEGMEAFQDALVIYQREIACQFRDDIRHLIDPLGTGSLLMSGS